MTEVEALLSVDAGRVPPDTVVFVAADPEAPTRHLYTFVAATVGAGALVCYCGGIELALVALLALTGGIFAVLALPPDQDPEEARHKRPTVLVTPRALIVRDDSGLRTWHFDELVDVRRYLHATRMGLLLVRRDGSREFLDSLLFRRGDRLVDEIGRRLKPHAG